MVKVYIKTNDKNEIIEINSSIFIDNTNAYILVDEGDGDKYVHAQSNYLQKSLFNKLGKPNFRYENETIIQNENTDEDFIESNNPTQEERIQALESAMLEMVLGGTE